MAVWLAGALAPSILMTGVSAPVEAVDTVSAHAVSDCPEPAGIPFIAHRGTGIGMYKGYAEDTISAALKGIQLGADGVENDIQETRDGVAVMQHDNSWDRMTNGHGLIKHTSSSILGRIRNQGGAKVPTLESYVKAVARTCASVMLENKRGLSYDTLKQEISLADEHFDDPSRVVFSASEPWTLARLKKISDGRYQTALIKRKDYEWPNLQKLSPNAIDIINVNYKAITAKRVHAAHRLGFLVSARNVDSPRIFSLVKSRGVDRVVGDVNDMSTPRQLFTRR
jgi:glycerophosphoryl diester phosphodiesterase